METIGAVIVWIVFGLFIGLIGRLLVPGRQPMGFLGTIVLGIVGSFAGGFLTYLFRGGEPLQPTGILMSIIGAIIVLVLGTSLTAKRV